MAERKPNFSKEPAKIDPRYSDRNQIPPNWRNRNVLFLRRPIPDRQGNNQ